MKCNSKQKCVRQVNRWTYAQHTSLDAWIYERIGMIMALYTDSLTRLVSSKYTFTADKFEGHIEY